MIGLECRFKFRPTLLPDVAEYVEVCIDSAHEKKLLESLGRLPDFSDRGVSKRKNEFYSGRWAAAKAISSLTGRADTPQASADRSPSWPQGLVGSISHTSDHAVAVVAYTSDVRRVGVDLESIDAVANVENLGDMIGTEAERKLLMALSEHEGLALLFSAKESLYKSLYPKVKTYFDYLDALLVNISGTALELRLQTDLGDAFIEGDTFVVNYLIQDKHVLTWQIDLL